MHKTIEQLLGVLLVAICLAGCAGNTHKEQAKTVLTPVKADSVKKTHARRNSGNDHLINLNSHGHYIFNLIRNYPVIGDTAAFIQELLKTCKENTNGYGGCLHKPRKINYYRKINIYGSDSPLILLEDDYEFGCYAAYPWKKQFLFDLNGKLIAQLDAMTFRMMNIFPKQNPFLVAVVSSSRGNGGHFVFRINHDTLENVYDGYIDYKIQTYDDCEDIEVFEPRELKLTAKDINHDGYNDLVFNGKIVLLMAWNGHIWYDNDIKDGKEISYTPEHPWKKVPVKFVFLYDPKSGHFKEKEDYERKYEHYGGDYDK